MTGEGVLDAVESALTAHFGRPPQRASMSLVGVDPIEVLRYELPDNERVYVSLGMSRRPMAQGDIETTPNTGPRAELELRIRDGSDAFADLWRSLAVLAATPAVDAFVYRHAASVDLGRPLAGGSRCTGIVTVDSVIGSVSTIEGEVVIYRALPATASELAWARARGTAALRQRWAEHAIDLLDLRRDPVRLD